MTRRSRIPRDWLLDPLLPPGTPFRPRALDREKSCPPTLTWTPPVVDQAQTWGQIAVASALTAAAATGRTPVAATVAVQLPEAGTPAMVRAALEGASTVALRSGLAVRSSEAPTGPPGVWVAVEVADRPRRPFLPRPGDYVMLARPLGTDVLLEAYRRGTRTAAQTRQWLQVALRPTLASLHGRGTGMSLGPGGLAEAGLSLARGVELDVVLDAERLPAHAGVLETMFAGVVPASVALNRRSCGRGFIPARGVAEAAVRLALGAEWTGGALWTADAPAPGVIGELRRPRQTRPAVRLMKAFLP
jgi:selenophosphate synthase